MIIENELVFCLVIYNRLKFSIFLFLVSEAVNKIKQKGVLEMWGATLDLLKSDVADHYRTFEMLEKLLPTPVKLAEEWTFQLHPSLQKFVIER